jgi:hypothetical protein
VVVENETRVTNFDAEASLKTFAYMTNKYIMITLRWILERLVARWRMGGSCSVAGFGIDKVVPVLN